MASQLHIIVGVIFIIEAAVKLLAYEFEACWADKWRRLECIIAVCALLDLCLLGASSSDARVSYAAVR